MMSSPLLVGCDMTTIPESSLALLKNKELIALNQDPLGLQAYVVQREKDGYVLVKDIERKRGKVRAVAFYNASDSAYEFRTPLRVLELGGMTKVRDLIRCEDMESVEGECRYTVQPHGVLICRMEAEERLEPDRYEAEWAYLPCFDDLGKNPKQILYAASPECSGGMKVHHLGGSRENYAEWREVYSGKGGEYEMTVRYCSPVNRKLEIWVNGMEYEMEGLNSGGEDELREASCTIVLNSGYNNIRMGNRFGWAPDVDCFTLKEMKK